MSVPVPVAVKNRRFALFVCLTLLLCAVPMSGTVLRARAGRAGAVIEGTVHDPSGKVVANAAVVVRNVSTDRVATATTDASGRFVVTGLPAGVYIVEVSASGFATSRRSGVRLEAGGSATLTFPLTVAPLSEQVTVTSTAPTAARSAPSQAPLDARSAESVISGEHSDFAGYTVAGARSCLRLLDTYGDAEATPLLVRTGSSATRPMRWPAMAAGWGATASARRPT